MISLGILGTARIARAFFQSPLKNTVITAVASRELSKANSFADEYKIPKRYGSYEALLEDKSIDAVYIPLPQHMHHQYVIAAANHGKHVLLEKPAALSVAELHEMEDACKRNNVVYMEAFMYRFMRIHHRMKELVKSGLLDELRYVNFNFCFDIEKRGLQGFRRERKLGGGALYDLGIYGVDFIRYITDSESALVWSDVRRKFGDGVDLFTHAVFQTGNILSTMTCSYDTNASEILLSCRGGKIYSPIGISGKILPNKIEIYLVEGERRYEENFPPEDAYNAEMEYFAECIMQKKEPFLGFKNSIANMTLIEKIMKS